uniref:Uncharacterized protein n=1 Tax=Timema monikensis TaxID=170555 RepID=A0A7R9HR29_9NEOP|nr:unnamed protein product [Timema monikensis]
MYPPLSTPDRDSNHDLPIDDTPFQLVLGPAQFVRHSLDESLGGALYGTAALRHRRRWSSDDLIPGEGMGYIRKDYDYNIQVSTYLFNRKPDVSDTFNHQAL